MTKYKIDLQIKVVHECIYFGIMKTTATIKPGGNYEVDCNMRVSKYYVIGLLLVVIFALCDLTLLILPVPCMTTVRLSSSSPSKNGPIIIRLSFVEALNTVFC
jgi:hypothetical protein